MSSLFEGDQEASEQRDAKAQLNLGVCYYVGKFVTQDYKKPLNGFARLRSRDLQTHRKN